MKTQRDEFLELLLEEAKRDAAIMLLSVDMGAPAIDLWKDQLPSQYLAMGISEQNAINVAAGLARGGKKVFVYMMAVWVHRCFEQIRYSCSIANNKISIIGNGVGLGYAPAGPAHEPNEDISVMRSLHNMNIFSSSSSRQIRGILQQCLSSKNSNYVRLERKILESAEISFDGFDEGFFQPTYSFPGSNTRESLAIISYGQIIRRVHDLRRENQDLFKRVRIIEISKLWPLDTDGLLEQLDGINRLIFIEEQSRSGSISEAISFELLARGRTVLDFHSIHLPNHYIFENGNQEELLDEFGFSKSEILQRVKSILLEDK